MNKEQLKALFAHNAANAKNAQNIKDAIASLPPGGAEQIVDFIIEFCHVKGIDPQSEEIQEYYKQATEYREALELKEKRADFNCIFSNIEIITKEFRDNEINGAIPTQEQINTITESINKFSTRLGTIQAKKHIYTMADYIQECLNYDPTKDFCPALFNGIAFADGTVSYIGARTSRGKTTAMVNLAREAITNKSPRKTIFITLEMSGKQIINKLILSTAFSMGIAADEENDPRNRRDFLSINANREIYSVWKNKGIIGNGANTFRRYVQYAHDKINEAQSDGMFIFLDGRKMNEPEIINFIISRADKGTIILLDYIQKMPSKPNTDTDSFRKVQAISYDVVNAAAKTNAVIIAGAQFNRAGGTDGLGDLFDDQSFREAGDIEQDAYNTIGIGWTIDKQSRFYEFLKTREDNKQGTVYAIDYCGEYSYMNCSTQIFRPTNNSRPTTKKGKSKPTPETALDENEYKKGFKKCQ